MEQSEASYRLYNCRCCARQVRICRNCDRGNQYCAGDCAQIRRSETLRRAGARYQQSYRGACRHAARQRLWRVRQLQKVTHQGSQDEIASAIVGTAATIPARTDADATISVLPLLDSFATAPAGHGRWPRCCFCGGHLPRFTRLGFLRAGP
jgi:hypothetical protein